MAQRDLGSDIVKKGYLHIKRPPCSNPRIRIKAWQKKYVILRDISLDDGVSTFEIYENEESFKNYGKPSYVLDLKNVAEVKPYIESKRFADAFTMDRKGRQPLPLACDGLIEKQSWMETVRKLAEKRDLIYKYKDLNKVSAKYMEKSNRRPSCPGRINNSVTLMLSSAEGRSPGWIKGRGWSDSVPELREPLRSNGPPTTPRTASVSSSESSDDGITKEFIDSKCGGVLVHILPSTDALRNRLSGDYYMNVTGGNITLTSVASLKEAIKWPLLQVQRFKSEENDKKYQLLSLEASVHCGKAYGDYIFQTSHGLELIEKVKDATTRVQPSVTKSKRQVTHIRRFIKKQSTTLEMSRSTPDLFNRVVESSHYVDHNKKWTYSKKTQKTSSHGTTSATTPYLELLDSGSSLPVFEDYSLDSLVTAATEYADSGFDDSGEDRSNSSHNDSLDVLIPVSDHGSITPSVCDDIAPPLPPKYFMSQKL